MTAAMTYLEAVNYFLEKSGSDLDQLTSVNFLTSTKDTHRRARSYVALAYREIQMERMDWEKTQVQVFKPLRPAYFVSTTASPAPTFGTDYIYGQESTSTAQTANTADSTGAWASSTFLGNLELDAISDHFKFGEKISRTNSSKVVQTADWAVIEGWGRYDLKNAYLQANTTYTVFEPDKNSLIISPATVGQESHTTNYTLDADKIYTRQLQFVPWEMWVAANYEDVKATYGTPQFFTETPEGLYSFYPHPDNEYRLRYYGTMAIDELSAYNDTLDNIPADFHWGVVWRAVLAYAEYQRKAELFAIANRNWSFYKLRMEELLRPRMTIDKSGYRY